MSTLPSSLPWPTRVPALAGLILTACLAGCGGGGGDGGDDDVEPTAAPTHTVNPSSTATELVLALPNATQLEKLGFTQPTSDDYAISVGGVSYTINSALDVTAPAGIRTYNDNSLMTMVCTPTRDFVVSNPNLSASLPRFFLTPVSPAEIAGKTFAFVDDCTLNANDTLRLNADGSGQTPEGPVAKEKVAAYFSTAGLREGNNVFRGHIYKTQDTRGTYYVIVETYIENGVEGVLLLVEQPD